MDVFHPDVGVLANLDGRLVTTEPGPIPETGPTVMKWVPTVELASNLHVTLITRSSNRRLGATHARTL
jgi:hypothetical protein